MAISRLSSGAAAVPPPPPPPKKALLDRHASVLGLDGPATAAELGVWALCGALMATGLSYGGMNHGSSLSFFDWTVSGKYSPGYHPGMFVFFMAALALPVLYWQALRRPRKPVFAPAYQVTANEASHFEPRLVWGSLLFGVGWALGGYCPASSMPGLVTGHANFASFNYGLFLGYVLANVVDPPAAMAAVPPAQRWRHYGWTGLVLLAPGALVWLGPQLLELAVPGYAARAAAPALPAWPLARSVAGGLLIGLASVLLMHFSGTVLGMSSLTRRIVAPTPLAKRQRELTFFGGWIAASFVVAALLPEAFAAPTHPERPLPLVFLGGALVALGTAAARGCTSGHGIGGLPRLSTRSWIAVPIFMLANFAAVPVLDRILP